MSGSGAAVLAVDGGNSKIDLALVSRSGELLALVTGPTISHQQVPMEEAMIRLAELNARAAREAGIAPASTLGVFCVAGADFPADVRALTGAFAAARVAGRVSVHNDAFAALRAGAPEGWGIVVVCGAGVNAAGVGPDGRTARLAGIGDLSGDWGGGEGIGREALAAAVRARDGRGQATSLARRVPQRLGVRRPIDVARQIYEGRMNDRRLEELAPLVFEVAGEGDAVARGIVDRLADELTAMAVAIARQLCRPPAGRRGADRRRLPRHRPHVLRTPRVRDPRGGTRGTHRPPAGSAGAGRGAHRPRRAAGDARRGRRASTATGVPGARLTRMLALWTVPRGGWPTLVAGVVTALLVWMVLLAKENPKLV